MDVVLLTIQELVALFMILLGPVIAPFYIAFGLIFG